MKYFLLIIFFLHLVFFGNFTIAKVYEMNQYPRRENAFVLGENIDYRVHYLGIDAGIIQMSVNENLINIDNHNCYKIVVIGETTGLLSKWLKIKQYLCSYLDSETLLPYIFDRGVIEKDYCKFERTIFLDDEIKVAELKNDNIKNILKERINNINEIDNLKKIFEKIFKKINNCMKNDVKNEVNIKKFEKNNKYIDDAISKWYKYRSLNFSEMPINTIVNSAIFFNSKLYDPFYVKFLGREEETKTDIGKMKTLFFAPKIPFNRNGDKSVFAGENSVILYLSDDENRIPIRIELKLFVGPLRVGTVHIDIIDYKNTKTPLSIIKT